MRIVTFASDHLEQVAQLEARAGDVHWSYPHFEKELSLPFSHFWVVEEEGHILGYGGFWKILDEAQITNLVICPERRRQGLGQQLLAYLLGQAHQDGCIHSSLEVRIGNKAARALYQQMGFIEIGRRSRFYSNPIEDAVIMEKRF